MVPPGLRAPEASAASIIRTAMRSFTEPPGLKYSTLASTVALIPSATLFSLTSGVLPTRSMIELWYRTGVLPVCGHTSAVGTASLGRTGRPGEPVRTTNGPPPS